jgi:hypothetical protein
MWRYWIKMNEKFFFKLYIITVGLTVLYFIIFSVFSGNDRKKNGQLFEYTYPLPIGFFIITLGVKEEYYEIKKGKIGKSERILRSQKNKIIIIVRLLLQSFPVGFIFYWLGIGALIHSVNFVFEKLFPLFCIICGLCFLSDYLLGKLRLFQLD